MPFIPLSLCAFVASPKRSYSFNIRYPGREVGVRFSPPAFSNDRVALSVDPTVPVNLCNILGTHAPTVQRCVEQSDRLRDDAPNLVLRDSKLLGDVADRVA